MHRPVLFLALSNTIKRINADSFDGFTLVLHSQVIAGKRFKMHLICDKLSSPNKFSG